jgi:homoserine O-acetyltransferase
MKSITKIIALYILIGCPVCRAQSSSATPADYKQQFASLGDFKLESGKVIQDCRIGYRIYGKLNSDKTNGILFLTWYTGNSKDVEKGQAPWKVIDTNKYCLITIDALGDGVSSSPSNSVKQHGPDFPVFSIRDMVNTQYQVLTQNLGIKHLNTVMGVSMGGFQTFQWGISYPDFTSRLIPVIGTPQDDGYDLMNFTILRRIIEIDPAFNHGQYRVNPVLSLAMMYLTFDLTTPELKAKSIKRETFNASLQTENEPKPFDWNDAYYQLLAILQQDIAQPYNGSLKEAAAHIKAKMLIITSQQDHMVSPYPAIEFAKLVPAKIVILNSDLGHFAPSFSNPEEHKSILELLADGE